MRRAVRVVMLALLAGCLVVVAGMLLQARHAARELTAVRAQVPELAHALLVGDRSAAARDLMQMQRRAVSARRATHGLSWKVVGHVPWLGRTATSVAATTATADAALSRVAPELLAAADALDLHGQSGGVDLGALAAVAGPLSRCDDALAPLVAMPSTAGVLPPVAAAARELHAALLRLRTALGHAQDAVRLLPDALGAHGTRRYFVAFQGSAEARGTGGLIGAYGVLEASSGRLSMAVVGSDRDLRDLPTSVRALGPAYGALYGRDPELWANANVSPHFPYAARLWLDKWRAQSGQQLDGAVAVDTTALAALLRATGPVTLPGGEVVNSADVVATTEQRVYARFADRETERKAYLVILARAVVTRLLTSRGMTGDVLVGMAHAVADGRVHVFSSHQHEEAALAGTSLAGEVPEGPAPYAAVVVNNAAGNKLDFYLRRSVQYLLGPCSAGLRTTRVRVVLGNDVPPGPLPDYVTGRPDRRAEQWRPGSTRELVALYATDGARLVSAAVDGVPASVRGGTERGHPVFLVSVALDRGAQRSVVLTLQEPARPEAARAPAQPLVLPPQTVVRDTPCRVSAQR